MHYGDALQHSLRDQSNMDMHMVGVYLSGYSVPIVLGFLAYILITGVSLSWLHDFHPEMIRICSQSVESLFERDFNFEPDSVEFNDLKWHHGGIRADEYLLATCGMVDKHKAHQSACCSPEQIFCMIEQIHILLPIERAGRFCEELFQLEE